MGSCSSCPSCPSCLSCPWCSHVESTDTPVDVEAVGMVAGTGSAEEPVKVVVVWRGEMTIELCDTEEQFQSLTVLQLKKKIVERLVAEDPTRSRSMGLHLSFKEKELGEDSTLLSERGIQHMSVINIIAIDQCDSCSCDSKEVIPDF